MINERNTKLNTKPNTKPNQNSKSINFNQKISKAENKKPLEFKSFSERKIKVSSKNKQK